MKKLSLAVFIALFSFNSAAKINKNSVSQALTQKLQNQFAKNLATQDMKKLKKHVLSLSGKSVPALITVMKNDKFPDKNRWMATFLLGKIMGAKSAPFISKFSDHPNWVMRMASLKTLLALKQTQYTDIYSKLLKDKSMIVRYQALENIGRMNLTGLAPNVWAMLYDKKNYHLNKESKSQKKRTHIIKSVIKTVGSLKFKKAEKPLLSMIQKKKYVDIHSEIDVALSQITGKKSPKDSLQQKKRYWQKYSLAKTVIK